MTPLSDNILTKYGHFIKYQKLGIAFLKIVSNIMESGPKARSYQITLIAA